MIMKTYDVGIPEAIIKFPVYWYTCTLNKGGM